MSEWIEHTSNLQPVDGNQLVFIRFGHGAESDEPVLAKHVYWKQDICEHRTIAYRLAATAAGPSERFDAVVDMVNHPPHYTAGGIECIEAIRAALTPDEFRGHCKANAVKYIWRERNKGGDESIRKAIWYLTEMLK